MKLDPSIPDLSIPELLNRVELEKRHEQGRQGDEIVGTKYQHANQPFFDTTGKLAKTQRTLGCGTCTGCTTTTDCGKCKMCLDKPKFGGPGKQKQRCILRKCQNYSTKPPLKALTTCMCKTNQSLEAQLPTYACTCTSMSSKLTSVLQDLLNLILLFTYSFFS